MGTARPTPIFIINELVIRQPLKETQDGTDKVLTVHVPLPLTEKVDQIAARLERSRGWIMKQALSAWFDQEEERERLTREALAEVDTDRVIDHQTVQAWADSLSTDKPLPHSGLDHLVLRLWHTREDR